VLGADLAPGVRVILLEPAAEGSGSWAASYLFFLTGWNSWLHSVHHHLSMTLWTVRCSHSFFSGAILSPPGCRLFSQMIDFQERGLE